MNKLGDPDEYAATRVLLDKVDMNNTLEQTIHMYTWHEQHLRTWLYDYTSVRLFQSHGLQTGIER